MTLVDRLRSLPGVRASTAAAADMPTTTMAVVIHFGPAEAAVEEEHSVFAVAAQLLRDTAPQLEMVPPEGEEEEEGGRDREGDRAGRRSSSPPWETEERVVSSLPLVRLPAIIVDENDEEGDEVGSTVSDQRKVVLSLGRTALEVRTYSHGVVVVSNWAQWEAARDIVLAELSGGGNTNEAISGGLPRTRAVRVEMHVELVVLWYDIDTMTALRFEDLFVGHEDVDEAAAAAGVDGYAHEGAGHRGSAERLLQEEKWLAEQMRRRSTQREEEMLQGGPGGPGGGQAKVPPPLPPTPTPTPHPQQKERERDNAPVPPRASTPSLPSSRPAANSAALLANLIVVGGDGSRRGEVQVYVTDPIVSLAELRSLVKGVLGVRRQHGVRLAYRVLSPRDLVLGYIDGRHTPSNVAGDVAAPRRGGDEAVAPPPGLSPIATQDDVERLVRDVLLYGYRAIRVVAVEAEEPVGAEPEALPLRPPLPEKRREEVAAEEETSHGAAARGVGGPARHAAAGHHHQPAPPVPRPRPSPAKALEKGSHGEDGEDEYLRRIQASLDSLHAKRRGRSEGQHRSPSKREQSGGEDDDHPSVRTATPRRVSSTLVLSDPQQVEAATPIRPPAHGAPPLEEPALSPPPRQPSGANSPSHHTGDHTGKGVAMRSRDDTSLSRQRDEAAPATADPSSPQPPYSTSTLVRLDAVTNKKTTTTMSITAKRTETETEAEEEVLSRHGYGNTTSSSSSSPPGTRTTTKREVVVVRYEVDPTEIFVTGAAHPRLLQTLADSIYHRCCCRRHGDGGAVPRFERIIPGEGEGDGEAIPDTSVNGRRAGAGQGYVLRLHNYDFDEEEEAELSKCVAEAMQSLDGYLPLPLND